MKTLCSSLNLCNNIEQASICVTTLNKLQFNGNFDLMRLGTLISNFNCQTIKKLIYYDAFHYKDSS